MPSFSQKISRTPGLRRSLPIAAAVALATAGPVATAPASHATSTTVVISEVYGGGGNSGAVYKNDFVELANRSTAAVSLAGWSVQYASASGTTYAPTALAGSIPAGGTYLVLLAAGTGTAPALPTPDATGTTNLSATSGKVALVTTTTALACGSACHAAAGVKDFVGYGTANDFEGSAAPGGSNTASVQRTSAADSDRNSADFTTGAPTPTNTTGGGGGTRIHDIQGAAHVSPLNGQTVSGVPGIVTSVGAKGFWMQDAQPDNAPSTSEGVYVFLNAAPSVSVGDSAKVSATVSEYRGSATTNLTLTELVTATTTVVATGQPLPAATLVGSGGRVPPASVIDNDATGDVETSGTFNATTDGIDFWESLEGMRVTESSPRVVGPRNSFGEVPIVPGGSGTMTARGGIVVQPTDFNPERILLDDVLAPTSVANVGDTINGSVTGVVDYGFGNFRLLPSTSPTVISGGNAKEIAATPTATQLSMATFNVENLAPTDAQAKFDGLATTIVANLRSPDILALEEVQDNDGATNSTVVACDQTIAKLVSAISAAGGPSYSWTSINPVDDQDGGAPGGNIRVGFLYRTDRGVAFVSRPGGTSTSSVAVNNDGGSAELSVSPGRIDPTDSAWASSRKPLAAEFTWKGTKLIAVANHFNSKGGDGPLFGHLQPPSRSSETQRHQQATVLRGFVNQVQAIEPSAKVVLMGDLNDFDFSQTADILVGSGAGTVLDLPRTLPLAERYTYVFEGNSQVLDHILLSQPLATYAYDIVHVNSEFATQVSDHDPQVVRLTF